MKSSALRQGLNLFNLVFVATFMVLALYSAIGQQIFPYIDQYRENLEDYLSQSLDGKVSIRSLSGDMDILTPSVHFEGITLYTDDHPDAAKVSVAAIDAVLDPRQSLLNLTPVFKSVRLSGLYVHLDSHSNESDDALEEDDARLIQQITEALLLQHHVELNNVTIDNEKNGKTNTLVVKHLTIKGDGFHHLITGNLSFGGEQKVNTSLRLYGEGSPYDLENFYARGALDIPNLDVDFWLDQGLDLTIFEEFSASAQLRFEFKEGLLNYAKLSTASPKIHMDNGEKFDAVNLNLWVKQKALNNWVFWLDKAQFKLKDKDWTFSDVGVGVVKLDEGSRWQGYAKEMDLEYLQQFLDTLKVIPDEIDTWLADLSPKGSVENLNVILQPKLDDELSVTVASQLKNISTRARGGIPSIQNLNGVLAVDNKSGRVQFDGQDMQLGFPNIYENPFELISGKGQVDWKIQKQGLQLKGDGLAVKMANTQSIKGGFKVWFFGDEQLEDKLELNLSLEHADVKAHEDLVPKILSSDLRLWLSKALKNGHANTGQFYLFSGLNESSISQTELSLDFIDGELEYLSGWPNVSNADGHLFVKNDSVYANISQAQTLGGTAKSGQVVFDGIKSNRLWVNSLVSGQARDGLKYFQITDLANLIGDIASEWQATGTHKTDFGLMLPLSEPIENLKLDIDAHLKNTSLNITDVGLIFNKTNGQIAYSSSNGLLSKGLSSHLWEQPIDLKIASTVHDVGFSSSIGFSGVAEVASLKKWLDLSLLNPISGSTAVKGAFHISGKEGGFTGLKLQSNLKGVDLDLPEPYKKLKETESPLSLTLALDDGQKLHLTYNGQVNLAMHIKQGQLDSGQVYLGSTEAFIPSEPGLEVLGHVSRIDFSAWENVWKSIQPNTPSDQSSGSVFRRAQLSTDKLIIDDFEMEQVKAQITTKATGYEFTVDAPLIKGKIHLQDNQPIDVDFQYIHWPALSQDPTEESDSSKLADVYPSQFPNVNFKVEEIFVGPINYGAWQGQLRSSEQTLSLKELNGDIKKMKVKGDIHWNKSQQQANNENTQINITITSKDVGGIQKAWKTKPVLEAKDGRVGLNLNWPANPMDVSTEILNGNIDLALKDGRFLEAVDAKGFSAFGILNFAAIGRRLRLDFSDVYQSGLHFDSVTGKVKLKDGLMTIIDTLDVKGPTAKFSASGTVNLNTTELNQELSVTFPITSTLPFVAILAGIAPPVAASLFVGEQLVGDQIEKFTSATYKLNGKWDEPNLKLMKRFDNEIEGKQDTGFWYRMKDFFGLGDDQ